MDGKFLPAKMIPPNDFGFGMARRCRFCLKFYPKHNCSTRFSNGLITKNPLRQQCFSPEFHVLVQLRPRIQKFPEPPGTPPNGTGTSAGWSTEIPDFARDPPQWTKCHCFDFEGNCLPLDQCKQSHPSINSSDYQSNH